jgi:hypothetical protein
MEKLKKYLNLSYATLSICLTVGTQRASNPDEGRWTRCLHIPFPLSGTSHRGKEDMELSEWSLLYSGNSLGREPVFRSAFITVVLSFPMD